MLRLLAVLVLFLLACDHEGDMPTSDDGAAEESSSDDAADGEPSPHVCEDDSDCGTDRECVADPDFFPCSVCAPKECRRSFWWTRADDVSGEAPPNVHAFYDDVEIAMACEVVESSGAEVCSVPCEVDGVEPQRIEIVWTCVDVPTEMREEWVAPELPEGGTALELCPAE